MYAGKISSMTSLSALHSGSMADEFFNRIPEQNFTIVQSKQGMR